MTQWKANKLYLVDGRIPNQLAIVADRLERPEPMSVDEMKAYARAIRDLLHKGAPTEFQAK